MEITKDKVTELFCIIDEFYKVFDAENAGSQSGVTRKFFDKYYKGREKAVALKIKECKEYKEAINPESLIPNFKVPQSFIYIEDKITPQIE